VPSIEMTSPSFTVTPFTVNVRVAVLTSMESAPQTQVLPMPRATTAACDVLPPRDVRMPCAAIMPARSSGFVSRRTRMTFSPSAATSTARRESKMALPTAAPGDAAMPRAIGLVALVWSNVGNMSWASWAPVTRVTASSRSISPSSTSCVAMTNAAAAVRLPTRVCSIQSLPRSMVNSMSHRSR